MASLKAIRRRIASVKSTQQITRAMKLISAARLRRAQEALLNARPYGQALARVADSLLTSEDISVAPAEGARPASFIAVVGSDRGLAGGYNSNLHRAAEEARHQSESEGLEVRIFATGRRAVEGLKRSNAPVAFTSVNNSPRLATIGLAREIAGRMLADYRSGAIREAAIVYTRFQSALVQRPTFEHLLPVKPPEDGRTRDPQMTEYLIEPSREALVPVVLQSYLEAAVLHGLLEAEASEHAARMNAMDNATNNASDMIETYTKELNRARQAQITRELMDIVGGAEALRGQA